MTTHYEKMRSLCTSWNDEHIKGFFGWSADEYGFLSNFHRCDVLFEGEIYPSSENAYMAAKTTDATIRAKFQDWNFSSAEAKKLGRSIKLRPNWEELKLDIMSSIVEDKFRRNSDIQQRLLDTGDRYLEETNWWNDRFYGVDMRSGIGENHLGKILMKVRSFLKTN